MPLVKPSGVYVSPGFSIAVVKAYPICIPWVINEKAIATVACNYYPVLRSA
jgi:hypothetical protein